jgi:transposase
MKAYSMDLRERIVAACVAGEGFAAVAARFGVCLKTVERYWSRHQKGELAPSRIPGRPRRVRAAQEAQFVAMVQEQPGATIDEFALEWQRRTQQEWGCAVVLPPSTLHDQLKRLDGRYKKRVVLPKSAVRQSERSLRPR